MKLRKSLFASLVVTLLGSFWTVSLWWHVPGEKVLLTALVSFILFALFTLAVMCVGEFINEVIIMDVYRERRKYYVPASTIRAAAKGEAR